MLDLAISNLTSIPVLAFVLGLLAVVAGSKINVPAALYESITIYLLLAIGIKGGVALSQATFSEVLAPSLGTLAIGVVTPILAFLILGVLTRLGAVDRGALAAHYGSTSLVTFTAATVFLASASIDYEGFVTTLLAILEVPAIIVGLMLAGSGRAGSWPESLREVITSKSVILLVGGLLIGYVSGVQGYEKVEPFFGTIFQGVLVLFLLELGVVVGGRLKDLPQAGIGLVVFAIVFPLISGTLGVTVGLLTGLSVGGAALLGVLAASASYIVAPAACRVSLPDANPGYYLTASLAITFPFNLIFGIPVYVEISKGLTGVF